MEACHCYQTYRKCLSSMLPWRLSSYVDLNCWGLSVWIVIEYINYGSYTLNLLNTLGKKLECIVVCNKLMIRLWGRFCIIFSLSLVYPWNSITLCLTEACRKLVAGKHLFDIFFIQNCLLDREHHDVLRINYKGRNLLRLAQLSFIIYGWIKYATCFDPAFGSSSGFNKELSP